VRNLCGDWEPGGAVEVTTVVKVFEVIEDGGAGLGVGLKDTFFGEWFAFDRRKRPSEKSLS